MTLHRPVRVLHVQKVAGIGGSEHHLLDLLQGLQSRGMEPRLAVLQDSSHSGSVFLSKLDRAGISYVVIPIHGHGDPRLIVRLVKLFRAWRPAIVHTHLIHGDLYGIPASRAARVPVVITTKHNDDPFRHGILGRIDRAISLMADRVIVISEHLKRFYETIEGIPTSRIVRIYYGLAANGPSPDGEALRQALGIDLRTPVAGVVARLDEQKGHRYLLEAFCDVRKTLPGAVLLIVGDGRLRSYLEDHVRQLGLKEAVIFTGFRNDVDAVMAAIDVFVLPSIWEGFGLVLLEAMRAAKPIVASRVSAIPEIVVDHQTGLLVTPADTTSLARALTDLLSNHEARRMMGEAGRRRLVQSFSCDRMIESTTEVYALHLKSTRNESRRLPRDDA